MTAPQLPDPSIDTQGSVEPTTGNEPPWANYLTDLPESVRPLVEPKFREWDASVTQRFQQVHSEYEPLKPWQEIAQDWDVPTTRQALSLLQALNDDPEQIYKALAESLGYAEQGQADPDEGNSSIEDYRDPNLVRVEEMTNAMAEIMLEQQRTEQEAKEDAELDEYLGNLKSQHGDFDEDYVLAHMQLGMTGEQAVAKFQQVLASVQQRPQAPVVMGAGGGLPSQAIDPGQLNNRETKDLIAQFLAQANNPNA